MRKVKEEALSVKGALEGWHIYLLVLLSPLLLFLAYQVERAYFIDVGGVDDTGYVRGFHEAEKTEGGTFRWTRDTSYIEFPQIGVSSYPLRLSLRMNGWRPESVPLPFVSLSFNGRFRMRFIAQGERKTYQFTISDKEILQADDLVVEMHCDTFKPSATIPGSQDPRELGVAVDWAKLERLVNKRVGPLGFSLFTAPPLLQLLWLSATILASYLLLLRAGMSKGLSFAIAGLLLLSLCAIIALFRIHITPFSSLLLRLSLLGYMIAILSERVIKGLYRKGGIKITKGEMTALLLIFLVGFIIKFGGLVHPRFISFDLWYHVHRLQRVLGEWEIPFPESLFWTIDSGLREFAGRDVPYLPTFYMVLSPLTLLSPDKKLLIQFFVILLDVSNVFLIFFLLKKAYNDTKAGLFASFLYFPLPRTFTAYSEGLYVNLFGQWLATVLFTVLALGYNKMNTRRMFWGFTLLLSLTLLSHSSIFTSVCVTLGLLVVILWLFGKGAERGKVKYLTLSLVLSLLIAFVLYYSHWADLMLSGITSILQERAEAGTTVSMYKTARDGLQEILNQIQMFYRDLSLAFITAVLGLVVLIRERPKGILMWLMVAWLLTAAFFALVFVIMGFSVRHTLFVLPAACICSGVLLSRIFRKGWLGQFVALALCAYLVWQGLVLWYNLIMFTYH